MAGAVVERLRGVEWDCDWEGTFRHVMSRFLLMREYLRRAALWAETYGAEEAWPFFDVTRYIDPGFRLPTGVARGLEECLARRPWNVIVRNTCTGAVGLTELRTRRPADAFGELPDLYEPLLLLFERGGDVTRDNTGALDLVGLTFRQGTLRSNLSRRPVVSLRGEVLDALDAPDGNVWFYTAADARGTLLRRRRTPPGGEELWEEFDARLRWERTDRRSSERVSDHEAAAFIESVTAKPTGSR